jgi:chemotaxis protein MotB
MIISKSSIFAFGIFILIGTVSCVSTKKFNTIKSEREHCEEDRMRLQSENQKLKDVNEQQNSTIENYRINQDFLIQDTAFKGKNYRKISNDFNELSKDYRDLSERFDDVQSKSQSEVNRILAELKKSKADIIKKEDSLSALQKELETKLNSVNELKNELTNSQSKLDEKEKAYSELMKEVKAKDSIMNSLKNQVAKALIGFEKEGLTITQKGGRVYVSMDEKLLFPSGSYAINPRGKEAITKLAIALENNPDINITVEGHTDSIPFKSNGIVEDNWDLSTKRATSIVRILKQNGKIDPSRIIAAGRAEFFPIESNTSREGRAKNRRTEIILMPDLDKLFKIIQ